MPVYIILCNETETITRRVWYKVKAASPKEAKEKVRSNTVPIDYQKEDDRGLVARDIEDIYEEEND